ncbi:CBS domain-containing protein [Neobacillus sp. MM2021_6]|uniref:CBS domain-containing protein n=1 Tax=Bacillaceae TaxID=186817 RepID=UPI0014084382|nr:MULTISPECIES: CBS domain-containing protein [Bacillaceae]MBO0958127.1 CBS domain-containing protein [Neobacillus sp. MM2021_6]NHC18463.1 CBS domain-containing protein [Bacillus sp. MM2020_4]WML40395.1 CBS domain-containing protein [Neobacillus sp. OS1-2]
MFVKNIMIPKHESFTVQADVTLKEALSLLETHQIDGLPVLQGEKYLGVATRFNIYEGYFLSNLKKEEYLTTTYVQDIVSYQNKYLEGGELFERTLLDLKDFPLLAVVDANKNFLGVVTRSDVISSFESAFGVNRPGVRIAFTSVETEGRIARLSEIAHQFHEHIISLVTFDETDKLVRRIVMKIEKKDNIDRFTKKLEEHGFRILSIQEDE